MPPKKHVKAVPSTASQKRSPSPARGAAFAAPRAKAGGSERGASPTPKASPADAESSAVGGQNLEAARPSGSAFVHICSPVSSDNLGGTGSHDAKCIQGWTERTVTMNKDYMMSDDPSTYTFPSKVFGPEETIPDTCQALLSNFVGSFTCRGGSEDGRNITIAAYNGSVSAAMPATSGIESSSLGANAVSCMCDAVFQLQRERLDERSFILGISAIAFDKCQCFDLLGSCAECFVDADGMLLGNVVLTLDSMKSVAEVLKQVETARLERHTRSDSQNCHEHIALVLTLLQMDRESGRTTQTVFSWVDLASVGAPSKSKDKKEHVNFLKAIMDLFEMNGIPSDISHETLVSYELYRLKTSVARANRAHSLQCPLKLDMDTPLLSFFAGCFSGESMLNTIVTIRPESKHGWETCFGLEFGKTLESLALPVGPVKTQLFANVLKRAFQVEKKSKAAIAKPSAGLKHKARANTAEQFVARLGKLNGNDKAFVKIWEQRCKNSGSTVPQTEGKEVTVSLPSNDGNNSEVIATTSSVPEEQRTSIPQLRGLSRCDKCKTQLADTQDVIGSASSGHVLCRTCGEGLPDSMPRSCDLCMVEFKPGESVFRCGSEETQFACQKCVEAKAIAKSGRPSSCSKCNKSFSKDCAIFGCESEPDVFLCKTCVEAEQDRPAMCSACDVAPTGSEKLHVNDDNGLGFCTDCWQAQGLPTCHGCGKPLSGSFAKVGEKTYHPECLNCSICSGKIEDACSNTPVGLACEPCCKRIASQMRTMLDLLQQGDREGATKIAEELRQLGLALPPIEQGSKESFSDCAACGKPTGASVSKIGDKVYHPSCLKCAACSESIQGRVAQTPLGLTCAPCAERLAAQVARLKAALDSGDAAAAAALAKELEAQGVQVPAVPPAVLERPAPAGAARTAAGAAGTAESSAELLCAACGQPAGDQPSGKIGDELYHRACLACAACERPLQGASEKLARTSLGLTCEVCCQDIQGQMQQLQDALQTGDKQSAVRIAESLKAKGLQIPI
eukprot:TRINITY_DN26620_c0_g1_i1.p1 TRINITY_DN26620_c0_g1~~TRINITY_DN26620_c0_g1_i1.p1  ORF type:complete len:1018 (-),score=146.88 TRINITY_DN26620_c0_g1_i1:143-3196(-)